MTIDQIGALVFFVAAAAIGAQGWAAARDRKAQAAWPTVEAVVAQTEPVTDSSGEDTVYYLKLSVDAPEGRVPVRSVIAQTQEDLDQIVSRYVPGVSVRLRRDPQSGTLFVEGQLPEAGARWLLAVAVGLVCVGVGAWFGVFRAFVLQGSG